MKVVKLGDIAKIYNGNSINENVKKQNFSELSNGTPYIATKDIAFNSAVNYENGIKIPEAKCKEFKLAKKDSVLICAEGGSAGRKLAILDRDVFFVNKLFCLETNNIILNKLIFYYLQSPKFQELFKKSLTGLIGGVSLRKVRDLPFKLPNSEVQKQMVDKLDKNFAEIYSLEKNLQLKEEKTNELLQSMLSAAFTSTEEFVMKFVKLEVACEVVNGGTPDTKNSNYWGGHHVWITPAEMGNLTSPYLNCSKRMISEEGLLNSSARLLPPYSVIISSRAPIGHLVINEIPMAFNQGCKGLIPKSNLNYKYLYYFLFANKDYLNSLGSGTTFAEISSSKIKIVEIPLPGLDLQKQIVEKLDKAFSEIDKLKIQISIEKERISSLRKSILSDAFNFEEEAA